MSEKEAEDESTGSWATAVDGVGVLVGIPVTVIFWVKQHGQQQ